MYHVLIINVTLLQENKHIYSVLSFVHSDFHYIQNSFHSVFQNITLFVSLCKITHLLQQWIGSFFINLIIKNLMSLFLNLHCVLLKSQFLLLQRRLLFFGIERKRGGGEIQEMGGGEIQKMGGGEIPSSMKVKAVFGSFWRSLYPLLLRWLQPKIILATKKYFALDYKIDNTIL